MMRTSGIKLAQKEKQIQKLRCWLKKAQKHQTFNPQVLKEDEKIKVLKSITEREGVVKI